MKVEINANFSNPLNTMYSFYRNNYLGAFTNALGRFAGLPIIDKNTVVGALDYMVEAASDERYIIAATLASFIDGTLNDAYLNKLENKDIASMTALLTGAIDMVEMTL